jgi:hypothetical protein
LTSRALEGILALSLIRCGYNLILFKTAPIHKSAVFDSVNPWSFRMNTNCVGDEQNYIKEAILRQNIYPGLCNRNLMKSGSPQYVCEILPMAPPFLKMKWLNARIRQKVY